MLESTIALIQTALILVAGLAIRALIAVAVIGAVVLPMAVVLLAWNGVQRLRERASGVGHVGHLRWRRGNYYSPNHLWIRPRAAGSVRIGLDDVAQRVLPEIAAITLPAAGTVLRKDDLIGLVRCFNGIVPLRSPLAGVVAAANEAVARTPSLLHADPYRRAWLVEVRVHDSAYESLPSGRCARAWLAREDERLTEFLEHQLGIAAADGGELMVPPHRLLAPAQWEALMCGFLTGETPRETA